MTKPRVVVPRAAEQAGALSGRLRDAGMEPVEIPVIAIEDAADGGAALAGALSRINAYDWVVVTSPNGAARIPGGAIPRGVAVAAVGPGTADALLSRGLRIDLLPSRNLAEGLVDEFPVGHGRVLLPQAEKARPVLAEGLSAKGWTVDAVVAYRTVPVTPPHEDVVLAATADAIAFTSGSTVRSYVEAAGAAAVPRTVVCIGPVTADTATGCGLTVAAVAEPHTLDGLVAAVVAAVRS